MDVERGARRRQDGEEWMERLERHLVQLSVNPTITLSSSSPAIEKLRKQRVAITMKREESLERNLVQLSSDSTIAPTSTKLGMQMGLNFDSTQYI